MLEYSDSLIMLFGSKDGIVIFDPNIKNSALSIQTEKYITKKVLSELNKTLLTNQVYASTTLAGDRFAFGTTSDGVFIINKAGEILQHTNEANGMQSNTVQYLYEDRENNLWAGLAYGITKIETASPFSIWSDHYGFKGSIYNNGSTIFFIKSRY